MAFSLGINTGFALNRYSEPEEWTRIVGEVLNYHYMHMVDYTNGGIMSVHSHKHNEDYSFILYLNDCVDGATVLHLENQHKILPQKGKVLLFSSEIPHSSEYSRSKQVFVGGLKVTNEV